MGWHPLVVAAAAASLSYPQLFCHAQATWDATSPGLFNCLGSATTTGGGFPISMTPPQQEQIAACHSTNKVATDYFFLSISIMSQQPFAQQGAADGMLVAFHNDPDTSNAGYPALGGSGNDLGYAGTLEFDSGDIPGHALSPSWGIRFDSWSNAPGQQSSLGTATNGIIIMQTGQYLQGIPDWTTGHPITINITYSQATQVASLVMQDEVSGVLYSPLTIAEVDLASTLGCTGSPCLATLAFTAATGGYWCNQVVNELSWIDLGATPTPSQTGSASVSITATPTRSSTATPTRTRTSTPSATHTGTGTRTATPTGSRTPTASTTPSYTAPSTGTPTATGTPTPTVTGTVSSTLSSSGSGASTPSISATLSHLSLPSNTSSLSASTSLTPSGTPSASNTPSPSTTATSSSTATGSQSPSHTPSTSGTGSATPTWTPSGTPTPSASLSAASTPSESGSSSPSTPATPSVTPSGTTASRSPTTTRSSWPTITWAQVDTTIGSGTATLTASPTASETVGWVGGQGEAAAGERQPPSTAAAAGGAVAGILLLGLCAGCLVWAAAARRKRGKPLQPSGASAPGVGAEDGTGGGGGAVGAGGVSRKNLLVSIGVLGTSTLLLSSEPPAWLAAQEAGAASAASSSGPSTAAGSGSDDDAAAAAVAAGGGGELDGGGARHAHAPGVVRGGSTHNPVSRAGFSATGLALIGGRGAVGGGGGDSAPKHPTPPASSRSLARAPSSGIMFGRATRNSEQALRGEEGDSRKAFLPSRVSASAAAAAATTPGAGRSSTTATGGTAAAAKRQRSVKRLAAAAAAEAEV